MNQIYSLEKPSAFNTSVGKNCYFRGKQSDEASEVNLDHYYQLLASVTSPELANYILQGIDSNSGKDYSSSFAPEIRDTFWSSHFQCRLEWSGGSPTIYKLNDEYDLIHNGYVEVCFPKVWLKEQYHETHRISLTPYWGFAVIDKVRVKSEKVVIYSNDRYGVEFVHCYMRDHAFSKELEYDAGCDSESNSLQTSISAKRRCVPLHLFYSLLAGSAFPVYKLKNFEHHMSFSLSIKNLLRIHKFEDGKWVSDKFDADKIEGLPSDLNLPTPNFYAELNSLTPEEKEYIHDPQAIYYVDDIVSIQSPEAKPLGSQINLKLTTNGLLCRSIFGAALNVTGIAGNNHFNFTDKADGTGKTPIEYISLIYGNNITKKIDRFHISHFKSGCVSKHYRSSPENEGHFAIALDKSSWIPGSGSGIQPEYILAEILIELRTPEPEDEDCNYVIQLRLRVGKPINISSKGTVSII